MSELKREYFSENVLNHLRQAIILIEESPFFSKNVKHATQRALEDTMTRIEFGDVPSPNEVQ